MPGPERDSRPWPLISAPTEIPTYAAFAAAAVLALLLLVSAAYYLQDEKLLRGIDVVGVQPGDTDSKTKQRYAESARSILEEATKKVCRFSHRAWSPISLTDGKSHFG